jgi:hypothetical protein
LATHPTEPQAIKDILNAGAAAFCGRQSLLVRAARDDKILMSRMAGLPGLLKAKSGVRRRYLCGRIETGHSLDDALAAHDQR